MTEKNIICPYCEKTTKAHEIKQSETLIVHDEQIEYVANLYRCNVCDQDFASETQEERNIETVYNIYRQRHNLVSPEQIKSIRKKYNLNQTELALLLGWDEITIRRYEKGALQNIAHNQLLVLLDEPESARRILNLNKSNLPDNLVSELNRNIDRLLIS